MSLIGLLLGIVFVALIIKAIYETVLGICLIIKGLFWHAVAFVLDAITFVPRIIAKRKQRKQAKAREEKLKRMMANPLIADLVRIGSHRPQQPQKEKETPKQSVTLSVARLNMNSPVCLKQP